MLCRIFRTTRVLLVTSVFVALLTAQVDRENTSASIDEVGVQDTWQAGRASAPGRFLVICPVFMHIARCGRQAAEYGLFANGPQADWLSNYLNINGLLKAVWTLP